MLAGLIKKTKILSKIIYLAAVPRARELTNRFTPYLNKEDKILDVGAGLCNISHILQKRNYQVTPLDIENFSFTKAVTPVLYNGDRMPFENDDYDCSLLITVLHHIPEPEKVLEEVVRVTSKKIIIIEDIYNNRFHKFITFFIDSLLNLDFFNHPHSNKSDKEWRDLFDKLGLTVVEAKYKYSFIVMKHATYYLEKK